MKKIDLGDNIVCYLGQTAKENWDLLDKSKSHHIFFHLSSFPSGYVILECEDELCNSVILKACEICKNASKYRFIKNIKVDYCRCDNLIKGDKTGVVYFKSNRKVKQVKI